MILLTWTYKPFNNKFEISYSITWTHKLFKHYLKPITYTIIKITYTYTKIAYTDKNSNPRCKLFLQLININLESTGSKQMLINNTNHLAIRTRRTSSGPPTSYSKVKLLTKTPLRYSIHPLIHKMHSITELRYP